MTSRKRGPCGRHFLLTAVLLAGMRLPALAQGLYYDDWPDDMYIETDTVGYPGQGCGGEVVAYSSLNGDDLSGSAFYPNTVNLPDSLYGSLDQVYPWSINATFYYTDPYSGGCDTETVSWGFNLGIKVTSSYWTGQLSQSGACITNVYCTNTNSPVCPGQGATTIYVYGGGACSSRYANYFLAEQPWYTSTWYCTPAISGDPTKFPFDDIPYYGYCSSS
ncbi:MAG TPA: hypothetical protein VKV29_03690 [Chthonomonas sp.]|uniref:hypothetical protein n=1 Tax=Chthonomonas sp. TaxID=2282153 RepID=UPI002B4B1767|nr:hypothetical protein [Chthonomonas sp.]HLH79366.1 hypothetical protein [Chthonomonas sp.]